MDGANSGGGQNRAWMKGTPAGAIGGSVGREQLYPQTSLLSASHGAGCISVGEMRDAYVSPPLADAYPLAVWEEEGGALNRSAPELTGTVNQVEWAERIRKQVDEEFDRVGRALTDAASRQTDARRLDTGLMLDILEEKRAEVMTNNKAGYFVHDWQELRDQVRKLIMNDARYKAIQARRKAGNSQT